MIEITGRLIDVDGRTKKQDDGSFRKTANIKIKIQEKYSNGDIFDKTLEIFTKADTTVLENSIGQDITLPVTYKKYKDKPGYFEFI